MLVIYAISRSEGGRMGFAASGTEQVWAFEICGSGHLIMVESIEALSMFYCTGGVPSRTTSVILS